MTFSELFSILCECVGYVVISIITLSCVIYFFGWLMMVLKKQTKIKWLCHHMYEKEWETEYITDSFLYKTEYDLKCRKCGKTKSMTIYHKEGSDLK